MKKILSLLGTVTIITSSSTTVIACGSNKINESIELIYKFIVQKFLQTNRVYYNDQEVINDFKKIVDSFKDEKIQITYDTKQFPKENLFLVSLEETQIFDRYTKQFRLNIFNNDEGRWSNSSLIGSEAIIEVKYGVSQNSIILDNSFFETQSGTIYETQIINFNQLENIEFSLDPFSDFNPILETSEINLSIVENKIIIEPKYDSFKTTVYLQATNIQNSHQIYGAELQIDNKANLDKWIRLNDQLDIDFVYPPNREIIWEVYNNEEINGIKAVYSSDPNFELIEIDNNLGIVKAIYNAPNNDFKTNNIDLTFVSNNTEYQILKRKFDIYPDNMYLADKDGNAISNDYIEIDSNSDIKKLDFYIQNYDSSKVKYTLDEYNSSLASLIVNYDDLKGTMTILPNTPQWQANYIYRIYLWPWYDFTDRYYKKLEILIKII